MRTTFKAALFALFSLFTISNVSAENIFEGSGSYLRLGLGAGALYVDPEVDSPVLGASVDEDTIPTVNIWLYPGEELISRVPLVKYFRAETALGVTTHDVSVGGSRVGDVSAIPLNLTLQLHPWTSRKFDPFVGVGFNRTYFTKQDLPGIDSINPTFGPVFQVGVNYWITDRLFIEADVRKFFMNEDLVSSATGTKIEELELDPLTVGLTLGFRF